MKERRVGRKVGNEVKGRKMENAMEEAFIKERGTNIYVHENG